MIDTLNSNVSPGSIVDQGILQQCTEHKEYANTGPNVDSLGVGHGWEGVLNTGLCGGHGQEGGHSKGNSSRNLQAEMVISWLLSLLS